MSQQRPFADLAIDLVRDKNGSGDKRNEGLGLMNVGRFLLPLCVVCVCEREREGGGVRDRWVTRVLRNPYSYCSHGHCLNLLCFPMRTALMEVTASFRFFHADMGNYNDVCKLINGTYRSLFL